MDLMTHGPMSRCVFTRQDHQKRKQTPPQTLPVSLPVSSLLTGQELDLLYECNITVNIKVHEQRQLTSQNKVKPAFVHSGGVVFKKHTAAMFSVQDLVNCFNNI